MRKILLGGMFVFACVSPALAAKEFVFEKSNLLFRPKVRDIFDVEHVGVYLNSHSSYRFTAPAAAQQNLPPINTSDGFHSVIHAPGSGSSFLDPSTGLEHEGIMITTLAGFLDVRVNDYTGSFEFPLMTAEQRQLVTLAAGRQIGSKYALFFGWKGTGNPQEFRCDGFARYVYAQAGFSFEEASGGSLANFPKDMRLQLGTPANARAPDCGGPVQIESTTAGYSLAVGNVKDDNFGSGIERVEFYNGQPSFDNLIATDNHNSTTAAVYQVTVPQNPGPSVYTRIYDQAGNFAMCDPSGSRIGTSDLMQVLRTLTPDQTPPTFGAINIQEAPGGRTVSASWSGFDNLTPAGQISYAYAIDVPFAQWQDHDVTIVGQLNVASVDVSSLTEGQHALLMIALDQEGNIGKSSVSFTISRPVVYPALSLFGSLVNDHVTYDRILGKLGIPAASSLSPDYTFAVDYTGSQLQSLDLFKNGAAANDLLPPAGRPPFTTTGDAISGEFPLPVGAYTLKATNVDGKVSEVSWRVVSLSASRSPTASYSSYDADAGIFHTTLAYDINSTLGAKSMVSYPAPPPGESPDPATMQYVSPVANPIVVARDLRPIAGAAGTLDRIYQLRDLEDNAVQFGVQAIAGSLGFMGFEQFPNGIITTDSESDFFAVTPARENLRGSIVFSGQHKDPVSLLPTYSTPTTIGAELSGTGSGPLTSSQLIGDYTATVIGADDPAALPGSPTETCVIGSGSISYPWTESPATNATCTLNSRYIALKVRVRKAPQGSLADCQQSANGQCQTGNIYRPAVNVDAKVWGVMVGWQQNPGGVAAATGQVYPGQTSVSLGAGVNLSGLTVTATGTLSASVWGVSAPTGRGYVDSMANPGFKLSAYPPWDDSAGSFINGPFHVQVAAIDELMTTTQKDRIKVLFTPTLANGSSDPCVPTVITPDSVDLVNRKVTFTTSRLGIFKVVGSEFGNPNIVTRGPFSFISDSTQMRIESPTASSLYAQFLNVLSAQGIGLVSSQSWDLAPSGVSFTPPGAVRMEYTPEEFSAAGSPSGTFAGQYRLDNAASHPLQSPAVDPFCRVVSARVAGTSSIFGVFHNTAPGVLADLLAPQTSLLAGGATAPVDAALNVTVGVPLSLSALDPPYVNAPVSGVAETRYLLDEPFVSTTDTPGQPFAAALALSSGTHTLSYYSRDAAGNYERIVVSTVVVSEPVDLAPPRTSLSVGGPSYKNGSAVYLTDAATLGFDVADDKVVLGDGLGVGTTQTFYAIDAGAFELFTASFSLIAEGTHTVSYFSIDREGNLEAVKIQPIGVDLTAPVAAFVSSGTLFALTAEDPVVAGTASGIEGIQFVVDIDPEECDAVVPDTSAVQGSCANPDYAGPFVLTPGTHTVVFVAFDRVAHEVVSSSFVTVALPATGPLLTPVAGPIGVPFSVAGASFGNYGGANTRIKFGALAAPVSVWNDTTIVGTIPGLSTGAYAVTIERQNASSVTIVSAGAFTVTDLSSATFSISSGPIGVPFTFIGAGFGPYAGTLSHVLVGGTTASLSVWNDTTITGTIPGVAPGARSIVLQRATSDGGLSTSVEFTFEVTVPSITAVVPSSGPIGTVFTLTGFSFGPYNGTNTQVLIGGATSPLSLWNDRIIMGTVPGALLPGVHSVVVERRTGDGGIVQSGAASIEVSGLALVGLSPSSGPIGVPFTITGAGFGTYNGTNTRVKFGSVVAPVSLWNDTVINGSIPAVPPGTLDVVVERQQGSGVTYSALSSFTVLVPSISSLTPASGPIGIAFTIKGSGFGPYAGTNTRALFGGVAAALSVWNDTTITGTIPALPSGVQPVWLERSAGSGVSSSATSYFTVTTPAVAALTPSSAPIGAPFTITGASFGTYAGTNTRVKFNGVAAPISVWNDATISGTVPGALSPGEAEVVVERVAGAGISSSAAQAFLVRAPAISTIAPAFGPVGTVVTLTGSGFGPYAGTLTKVLVGGATVPVSVWNDATIRWTVTSSFADGEYPVVVQRSPAGGTVDSASATFAVGTGYGGASFGFTAALSLAATPDSHFEGDLTLSSAAGGRIDTPAKAAVDIPANAMEADTEITLKRLRGDGLRAAAADEIAKRPAGEPIEFGPEGTRFLSPVTIELPYDPALVADESQIAIHYYDPLRREWEELPSVVDRARKVVKAKTDHFSIYQPMGLAPMTAAQDEFYFRDSYAFPNPSRGGSLVTFRIQPGLADSVEVRVYDLSGRKIHGSSDFTFLGAIDDGNGKGAQNTYDHAWNVGGVGSGVYNFVIKASRAGHKSITKSGKVGVVK